MLFIPLKICKVLLLHVGLLKIKTHCGYLP